MFAAISQLARPDWARVGFASLALLAVAAMSWVARPAACGEPIERHYVTAPAAPAAQSPEAADSKSQGCRTCHTQTDSATMHPNAAVNLGCTDCHGGNAQVSLTAGLPPGSSGYRRIEEAAHVLPRYPSAWHYPSSANPQRTYTLLNREAPEFVRFINPSDFRVARESCGACHQQIIEASVRSMHATGVMLWGGASYNNGILDDKNYILGESYTRDGVGAILKGPVIADHQLAFDANILPQLYPLPAWETMKPGDIFRIFERGGRNISNLFPETGLPDSGGELQKLEEPGRPDFRASNRGPGTGARIAVPVINLTKTRLNDPNLWFMGTNDQPGDYRQSGCAACHVIYANDRDPAHSSIYASAGHDGTSQSVDPTTPKNEPGHPLQHTFTRAIPTSQCMVCHMHQPNMFLNSMLGYTMWDYESDAPAMWPARQQYPSIKQQHDVLERNPEGAAVRGKWADVNFLGAVADLNPTLKDTQFADYHGHGWNFRAVFKRDRAGDLLDAKGDVVADDDPQKFQKAVHMASAHVDVGMQCVDCHFQQDNHGNGYIYGEVAAAVEIGCKDCHGTVSSYPNAYTSGPAALGGGLDLMALRTPDGRRRFEWVGNKFYQRSMVDPKLEWQISLVKDSVTPGNPAYNEKAARAKLMSRNVADQSWSLSVPKDQLAHSDSNMECYACHTSWTTSCGGCHLPIEANNRTERHHYEGGETRNYATYNPQVARDDMFLLGHRESDKGGKIAPFRSSSALVLSSTDSSRAHVYVQQPPISAAGYSSQAFNAHYPHTERKVETKTCDDCHLGADNDNNAIMAQLLMFGTNFVNFVGYHAYVGGAGDISAVQVTEWDEPQAVIGSYLHRYAYPDYYAEHLKHNRQLQHASEHSAGDAQCLQLRGEYLYVAEGRHGMQVYDVSQVGNKNLSEKVITTPFSPLADNTHIGSQDATCVALPTNQPINPARNAGDKMRGPNQEAPFHPMYSYAYITDAKEGLILTNVNTLVNGDPRDNSLKRAVTWNPGGVLNGARHLTIGGYYLYISTPSALVIVSVDDPLNPKLVAQLPLQDPRASALQFRYLFVTDARGLEVVDVTHPETPRLVPDNAISIADAHRVYVARTYAYVAAGKEGLVIVNVERPEAMREQQRFNAGGKLVDSRDVVVASTNASLFAYVADGAGGLKVLQLMSPQSQPKFYGFSPVPAPEFIASYPTGKPALSLSKGLDRDRAIDETGNQIAVFGRRGTRPLSMEEMRHLYLDDAGKPWFVKTVAAAPAAASCNPPPGFKVDADCHIVDQNIIIRAVDFEVNSTQLTGPAQQTLDQIATALEGQSGLQVEVQGYTDSTGSREYNLKLSEGRAQAVRSYLTAKGVDGSVLSARGYGPDKPIASNKTAEGRAQNRRVSFNVTGASAHMSVQTTEEATPQSTEAATKGAPKAK
jgi:outer membrane protein OmpA-like peptidoglycan-associated protein